MFLSDFFFFCQSTATVLILRYCLMNTAVMGVFFLVISYTLTGVYCNIFTRLGNQNMPKGIFCYITYADRRVILTKINSFLYGTVCLSYEIIHKALFAQSSCIYVLHTDMLVLILL